MSQKATVRPWSADEDRRLLDAMAKYGDGVDNWKDIAAFVPGRTNKACRKRWLHSLCPSIKKSVWTKDEDRKLIKLHSIYGNKWSTIARFIDGRTDDACSKRFREALDPTVKKDEWSPEEDAQLLEIQKRLGSKWKEVGLEMQRSSLDCRNRCRLLVRRGPGRSPGASGSAHPAPEPPVEQHWPIYVPPEAYGFFDAYTGTNLYNNPMQFQDMSAEPPMHIPMPVAIPQSSLQGALGPICLRVTRPTSTPTPTPEDQDASLCYADGTTMGSSTWSVPPEPSTSSFFHDGLPDAPFATSSEDFSFPVMDHYESPTSSPETTPSTSIALALPPTDDNLGSPTITKSPHVPRLSATRKRMRQTEDTRLSASKPVNPHVNAYACGHPMCWPLGQEESRSCFATSGELSDHSFIHAHEEYEEKPFRCALCGTDKKWKTINGLQYHLQISPAHFQDALRSAGSITTANEGKYKCKHAGCNKTYKQLSGLGYHEKHGHKSKPIQQLTEIPDSLMTKLHARSANPPIVS